MINCWRERGEISTV